MLPSEATPPVFERQKLFRQEIAGDGDAAQRLEQTELVIVQGLVKGDPAAIVLDPDHLAENLGGRHLDPHLLAAVHRFVNAKLRSGLRYVAEENRTGAAHAEQRRRK